MADGSIRIETKLDNSALKQQVKELERELNAIRKEQEKAEAQANKVRDKYDAEREFDSQFPEEFSHRRDIDEKYAKELDPIVAKQEELNQKEQNYLQMLESVNAKLAEQADIASASKQVDNEVKATSPVDKISTQAQYNSLLEATAAKMEAIEAAAARIASEMGLSKEQILAANPGYQKLSDTMGILKSRAGEFGDEAKAAGKKASVGLKDAHKSADGLGRVLKKGIRTIGKMALAIFGIRGAYMAVRMAMNEYLATNEQLAGQMATLKAGFGQVLGPVIQWVINLLIQAISVVNAFVYALTGINFIARANAAALKKQGAAAGGAAKAQKQLAAFDEQTKLNDTSGGGGGGGSPISLLDEMLDSMPAFMEKLIEQVKAGDWYGAGITVGEALMDAISSVDWFKVGKKMGEILGGAAAFALGLALSIDPMVLLKTAVNLVAGLFSGIADAIQNVNWNDVGQRILTLLLLAIAMANPVGKIIAILLTPGGEDLIKYASELIGSIVGALLAAIAGMAQKLGDLALDMWDIIHNFFDESVDWGDSPGAIIKGLWDGITAAMGNVGEWIYQIIWVPFSDGFKEAFGIDSEKSERMKAFGASIMEGLRDGISEAMSTVVQTCVDIWSAIEEAVLGAVAAITDTELFKEISGAFTELWGVIKAVWDYVEPYFRGLWNAIKGIFSAVATWFGGVFKSAWIAIKGVWDVVVSYFETVWASIKEIFSVVEVILSGYFETAWAAIRAIWDTAVSFFTLVWAGIKAVFSVVKAVLSGDFSGAWSAIQNVWNRAKEFFSTVWNGIKSVFSVAGNWFGDTFKAAWSAVKNVFSTWGSFFSGLWDTIKNTFSTIGTNIASAISKAVKTGINGVISMIEGTINTAVRLINGAINLINKIPGVSVGTIGTLRLPRLARGGIVNNPGKGVPAVIGEAGPEAVLPLSGPQGEAWMDILADKIGGGTVIIPITLDGKRIATHIVDIQKKKAFATNGA